VAPVAIPRAWRTIRSAVLVAAPTRSRTARVDDLGPGDFVKVDCGVCDHTALLSAEFLSRLGVGMDTRVLDLALRRLRCRGCGVGGRADVSIKWGKPAA
jgi:hypothetical protein